MQLTIQGSKFKAPLTVRVGKDECQIKEIKASRLVCAVSLSSRGVHRVVVTVDGEGQAAGQVSYDYKSVVDRVSPSSGHRSGQESVLQSLAHRLTGPPSHWPTVSLAHRLTCRF